MVKNSPESLLSYNREERTFRFNNKLYSIRSVERVHVISNENGVDIFYFNVTLPYMNYPEQVSIYTSRCKSPAVDFYMSKLNSIIYGDIPERWREIWIIALFKNLSNYFGEDYLIAPSVLDKNGQFYPSSYSNLSRLCNSFKKDYPDSIVEKFPYTRNSFEIDIILAMILEDDFFRYFKPVDITDMLAYLVTPELQMAYTEIYSEENIAFLHYDLKAMDGVNDAILSRKTFVVFKGIIPVFAFSSEYENLMLSI